MPLAETWIIEFLGSMSDWELSQITDTPVSVIFRMREELGIPAYPIPRGPSPRGSHRERRIYWTQEMDALLGTMSDQKVADKLGLPPGAVREHRRKLGIPASRPYKRRK